MMARTFVFLAAFLGLVGLAHRSAAQCTPLPIDECDERTGVPVDYSIYRNLPWWTVIAVSPDEGDDKDIALYGSCASPATILASSIGIDGTDFIIGDFNHNPYGTYYPHVSYGSAVDPYVVSWDRESPEVFPVSLFRNIRIGGTYGDCDHTLVFDLRLEANAAYEFRFSDAMFDSYAALFYNPAAAPYWSGRFGSEFEMTGPYTTHAYTAPATDWYGLVLFPRWREFGSDTVSLDVERLYDCIPLTSDVSVENNLYTVSAGPRDNYKFDQSTIYWAAAAVASDPGTHTSIAMYTACDQGGEFLTSGGGYYGDSQVIVGDFNHNPMGMYYPVMIGYEYTWHTVEWEGDAESLYASGGVVSGDMGGTVGAGNVVDIYDVYLEANQAYGFSFSEWGSADIRVELFRNPSSGSYWAVNGLSEWGLEDPGPRQSYVAPQTDWYGLAIWANRRNEPGTYLIEAEKLGDCMPLTTGTCPAQVGLPRDFSYSNTGYWSVVGVLPGSGDDKDILVASECDGGGTVYTGSAGVVGADFVVGDFNHNTGGTYYPRVIYGDRQVPYVVECDTGANFSEDVLSMGELVNVDIGVGNCNFFKVWDVFLEQGHSYRFEFTRNGPADERLALFANPGNGTYWGGRSDAVWEMTASGDQLYVAPRTDWYGVVAFANVSGQAGSYTLRIVDETVTAVESPSVLPDRYALRPNVPNPFNPATLIAYDVPPPGGEVSIRIYDVHGQLVCTLREGAVGPGEQTAVWNGRDERGHRVASGVYVCRMEAAGFSESRKLVLMK